MRFLLAPLSWIYYLIVEIRNWLFDEGVLRSWSVSVPTICVGNLVVGGTGKTPHVEYLVRKLSPEFKVAVLSRGYKRKTSGFVLADETSTAVELGDEMLQLHQHFPDVPVAVCEHRVRGINLLLKSVPDIDVVILDDGMQHRHLKVGFTILLTAYEDLYVNDYVLPLGRLREPQSGSLRANAIIVTKCPEMQPIERRVVASEIKITPFQSLYFSTLEYGELYPVFPDYCKPLQLDEKKHRPLILTGIVNNKPLEDELQKRGIDYKLMAFADHHWYTKLDIKTIEETFANSYLDCIVTTEKDAARLKSCTFLSDKIKRVLYAVPIQVKINSNEDNLIKQISLYVTENNRNR
ncbi:MAG: tetraacyldisaccharide 4'-kinase [Paludibacteraceae bacterium]|nr:tetraacyldisaccharide 4'-kinase [Paludibacteraceae bacterium]